MNVLLQEHGAKHIYKVPEGLRELCTDIAREVLRSQPRNIYCFIADYVEALLITRENTKVAVKVVNNILLGSQAIVGVLYRSGLSLEQIARAAPRIQEAFRAYLDAVDTRAAQVCDDATCDKRSKVCLESILQATGASLEEAERAAAIIQAAFRGHYERMLLNESQGMIPWQRAATRTLEILKKAGASQAEMSKAAILIQATYRGYYTRRNLKMKMMVAPPEERREDEEDKGDETLQEDMIEPQKSISAVAWLDMMSEESEMMNANRAASIIQKAYRRYSQRKSEYVTSRVESTKSIATQLQEQKEDEEDKEDVTLREDVIEPQNVIASAIIRSDGIEELRLMKAHEAASVIQNAYRQYRQRKSEYITSRLESTKSMTTQPQEQKEDEENVTLREDVIEPQNVIASTIIRLDGIEELRLMKAHEAASIIQKAYRQYRQRRSNYNKSYVESKTSAVIEVNNINHEITDTDIFTNNREDLKTGNEELVRVEESRERPAKLVNYDTYPNDVAEDREENREIEVESERDEGTEAYVRE